MAYGDQGQISIRFKLMLFVQKSEEQKEYGLQVPLQSLSYKAFRLLSMQPSLPWWFMLNMVRHAILSFLSIHDATTTYTLLANWKSLIASAYVPIFREHPEQY